MSLTQPARGLLIGLALCSVIILTLEGGLRAFSGALPARLQEVSNMVISGTPFAEPWERAWIRNPDHYYILKPGLTDALQFGSVNVRFHVSTSELWPGGGIGFRARPVDYYVDVAVVGDSFTFCFTELEDCWVTQLEALTGLAIVNLGLPGTGSQSHSLVLQDFGRPLEPPLVIWQFYGNDFNDDYGLLAAKDNAGPIDQELQSDAGEMPHPVGGPLGWLRLNSLLFALLEVAFTGRVQIQDPVAQEFVDRFEATLAGGQQLRFGQAYEPRAMNMDRAANQTGFEVSRAALASAQELVASWDGRLVLVLVPTREEVYEAVTAAQMAEDLGAIRSARLAMREICADLGLDCYDPLADMQREAAQGELLYYTDDLHLNPAGNRLLAALVSDWLANADLLPE